MNATGESDMQNYYDTIEEKQETSLRPIFDKLLPIVVMSTLGAIPDDFDFEFKPVRKPNDNEMADLASKNTDSVTKAFQAGMISVVPCAPPDSIAWTWRAGTWAPWRNASRKAGIAASNDNARRVCSVSITTICIQCLFGLSQGRSVTAPRGAGKAPQAAVTSACRMRAADRRRPAAPAVSWSMPLPATRAAIGPAARSPNRTRPFRARSLNRSHA